MKWSIKCNSKLNNNGQYIIWVNEYTINNIIKHGDEYMQPNESFDISNKIDILNREKMKL